MKEERIDISQIEVEPLPEKPFPAGPPFRIFMAPEAHEAVWDHAREADRDIEVGGVLIGDVCRDEDGPFLEVTAAIAGEHTKSEGTQLTFTPETWEHVNKVKDKLYPKQRIVGWYHTHPRFGIFLSERDRFIQKLSFSQPWATAFVLDPVQETDGFFIWRDGEPKLAPEYWVGSERRGGARNGAEEKAEQRLVPASVSRASFALAAVVGFLALLFLFGYVYTREVSHAETEKFVFGMLEQQKAGLMVALQDLASVHQALEKSQADQQEIRKRIEGVAASLIGVQRRIAAQEQALSRVAQPEDKP